ncbi:hypothetical protein [Actinophytocola xanthii]|uniref:hypothetical protein n=1 Tax=Actinophytocola xanthii TaxID=1912961 RepID=UPI0011783EF2|nr:hypothetical protein [Actinophytocola xanthii]
MTGWQGNEGDQGGQGSWGPQGTQPYGSQPYGNQPQEPYGGAPYYGNQPYGQDPYGGQPSQYGYPGGYQTGGFPAQGYQTGGFPSQGFPPPPPPARPKLPMVLGVLAIVIIVGVVVTIVLVNRDSGEPTAGSTESTAPTTEPTDSGPGPSTRSGPSSSEAPTSEGPGTRDGWQKIDNSADSGLVYEVPPEWKAVPDTRASGLGVDFTGTADYASYRCEGANYVRSYATSGDVQAKDGAELDLAKTVKDFANSFALASFKDTATVSVPEPTETEVDGRPAMTLAAKVTPKVTIPGCEATEGEVAIIGVELEADGEPAGVAMLVVVSDVSGGPADPKPLPKTVAQEILASTALG